MNKQPFNSVVKNSLIIAVLSATTAHAQTYDYSFGDSLNPGGITLANGTVMTGSAIVGGKAVAGPSHGDTRKSSPAIAGGNYTGVVFSHPNASSLGTVDLMTRIQSSPRKSVERGNISAHRNFIGFHISFSSPTMLRDFYALDLDGSVFKDKNNEWFSSFAYNGDTLITPQYILNSSTRLEIKNKSISNASHSHWQDLVNDTKGGVSATRDVMPSTIDFAINQNSSEQFREFSPDNPAGQVLVDYETTVTDLYILWGIEAEIEDNNNGSQNSGITGFSLDVAPVPEPSSTALLGLGGLTILLRRNR